MIFFKGIVTYLFIAILFASAKVDAQNVPRTFGARAFQIDDGTGSGKTFTWDLTAPLSNTYRLHLPNVPPPFAVNYLITDFNGNMSWSGNLLPPLAPGNIWYGNAASVATPLPPSVTGALLTLNASLLPSWTTVLPAATTVPASQVTSGTLPAGTTITVGAGSVIQPGAGTIISNSLSGSGVGKFSGKIPIPTSADHMDIAYTGITAFSSVTVSVFDPQATTFGFVDAKVSLITPGVGFRVIFAADYPNSGTGQLHYTVVNP